MSARPRRNTGARKAPPPPDLWRPVPAVPDHDPIVPAGDPTALLRSLGSLPLPGPSAVADHYVATVVERAAALATALAASAGLLAADDAADDADHPESGVDVSDRS